MKKVLTFRLEYFHYLIGRSTSIVWYLTLLKKMKTLKF